jgi:hypothetical protein
MSQARGMIAGMKTSPKAKVSPPVQLVWSHAGVLHRAGPWPEVRFERQGDGAWHDEDPGEESFADAAAAISPNAWRWYLDYVPIAERVFLGMFQAGRIAALQVLARCPDLVASLIEAPALTVFLAAHQSLRGTPSPRWAEINAVHERGGIFGVLEWLGLPASQQTLAILQQIADPDLPIRLLEPLRASLWDPEIIWALQRTGEITNRQLMHCCNALAA